MQKHKNSAPVNLFPCQVANNVATNQSLLSFVSYIKRQLQLQLVNTTLAHFGTEKVVLNYCFCCIILGYITPEYDMMHWQTDSLLDQLLTNCDPMANMD